VIEMKQVPGYYRRRFGDLVVTALNDGVLDLPLGALVGIEEEEASVLLVAAFRAPTPRSSVNCYLVQGGGRTVLIDTGAGGSMGPGVGHLQAALAAAGAAPGDVDTILMTHLHRDHFGGLASDAGTAIFPRAELVIPQAEADYWLNEASAAAPDRRAAAVAGVAPYRARLRMLSGTDAAPGIVAEALPGHTPGHTGYLVGTGGTNVLIWGDIMHVPDIQAQRPDVTVGFDIDPAQAIATRRRVLDLAAQDRLVVGGMHMHFPGFAHIARAAGAYAVVPAQWTGGL